MGFGRRFIEANIGLSRLFDRALPAHLRRDGNKTFLRDFLPNAANAGDKIYDLGGGSQPFITLGEKERLGLTVIGLDIDSAELAGAPPGIYDQEIVADLCSFVGPGDGDLAVCQATLEHVPDTAGAMRALATIVKPGGRIFIFAPSRNALFARINLILPENLKKRILYALFPQKAAGHDGFKAFYDQCTPREIEALAAKNGLVIEERQLFWISSYFMAFTPAYLTWRLWQVANYVIRGDDAAETFLYVLGKPDTLVAADGPKNLPNGKAA